MTGILILTTTLFLFVQAIRALRQTARMSASVPEVYEARQPVLIICGDCSGEGRVARKTLLTRDGHCAGCGGDNYVLASACGMPVPALTGQDRMMEVA
ncbi:MAG TPA: hypothetical protein VNQ79_13920 [Blastocatellia bacterium]|nr:hypothetical protein [Blastocatellia bacterium]